jgi:proline dehydrogenase
MTTTGESPDAEAAIAHASARVSDVCNALAAARHVAASLERMSMELARKGHDSPDAETMNALTYLLKSAKEHADDASRELDRAQGADA